jgi:hypothetical protein
LPQVQGTKTTYNLLLHLISTSLQDLDLNLPSAGMETRRMADSTSIHSQRKLLVHSATGRVTPVRYAPSSKESGAGTAIVLAIWKKTAH